MKAFWHGFFNGVKTVGEAIIILAGFFAAILLVVCFAEWLGATFGAALGLIFFVGLLMIIGSIISGIYSYRTYQIALDDVRRADNWYNICKNNWEDAFEKYGSGSIEEIKAYEAMREAIEHQVIAQENLYQAINGNHE